MTPDFLVVGHVAKDVTAQGFRLGGVVAYASLTALRMGLQPAVVTSADTSVDLASALPGVLITCLPSPCTTTFQNTYTDEGRRQTLRGLGGRITTSDVPGHWRACPLVLLAPIAQELDYGLARAFPESTVIVSPQGWVRTWDEAGRVSHIPWQGREVLPYVHAAIVSHGEVAEPGLVGVWRQMLPVLVVTRGRRGARLHYQGSWHQVRAYPAQEVDPTGAGDVFAAAYLIRYQETGEPLQSARFASCAASFCVEAEGLAGVPTRAQVEERLRAYPD